jgi:serine/threonine protein kinase
MIGPNTLLQNRYLVQSQIGQGGMGAVYIATDQRFGSTVALKETFFNDPGLRKAFEREARLLNHLRHPALPRVSDHFMEEEGQFLVMEYIPGDDLAEKLNERGGAFPLSEVLNWADQLLDALDYLHTHEPPVIHRDIKPQNLKLTPRKHIVLLDFGLAKGASAQTKVTATGSIFGYSRNYAPLEQIQGAGTDPRSDLYSLAATLYHLMTGVTPPDALTRATAVLNGQPDPLKATNEVHPQVTPAVASVISKAMAQNAGQRPQTAAEMRDAMRDAARQTHSSSSGVARDTNALPTPPTNVYEQDTQLMFAASPATRTGEAAQATGVMKGDAATAAINSASASASASTDDAAPDSVVTKVAKAEPTRLKTSPRKKRNLAIAASAALLVALAAAVYTFTRNNTTQPTPATPESIQNVTTTPGAGNTENQTNQQSAETVNQTPSTPAAAPQTTRQPTTPAKPTRAEARPDRTASPADREETEAENETPEPPVAGQQPAPLPPRRARILRPGDPEFEEMMRKAEEQRRAAQEQRRIMLQRRREILERERRRQQQQQQPYP